VDLDKLEALKILDEIEENISICCAITMEPDDVLNLLTQLRKVIENS
tara:strand:+ start:1352 stop:1492 length:141 start_codon:yes stop_codon:yes gene_type:complete